MRGLLFSILITISPALLAQQHKAFIFSHFEVLRLISQSIGMDFHTPLGKEKISKLSNELLNRNEHRLDDSERFLLKDNKNLSRFLDFVEILEEEQRMGAFDILNLLTSAKGIKLESPLGQRHINQLAKDLIKISRNRLNEKESALLSGNPFLDHVLEVAEKYNAKNIVTPFRITQILVDAGGIDFNTNFAEIQFRKKGQSILKKYRSKLSKEEIYLLQNASSLNTLVEVAARNSLNQAFNYNDILYFLAMARGIHFTTYFAEQRVKILSRELLASYPEELASKKKLLMNNRFLISLIEAIRIVEDSQSCKSSAS